LFAEVLTMSAPLSFSPAFFMPSESSTPTPGARPSTVLEALEHKRDADPAWWQDLATTEFGCAARFLDVEHVLSRAVEVNACTSLFALPIEVHLDLEGGFVVEVYDDEA
jgi:hypothetical protein